MRAAAAILVLAAILPSGTGISPAAAQVAPETQNGQFSFHRVNEGYLRLDTRSGQVSLCSYKNLGWTCETVADERQALENEIARLQTGNAALKKELLARGLPLPETVRPDAPAASEKRDLELKLPNHADVDRVFNFVEKVWKRLVDMIVNLQKDGLNKT